MISVRDCCDWTSLICVMCHARGDRRIGVHLADEISLVRHAYARAEECQPQHTWWVEKLLLECGCTAWRVVSSATKPHHLVTERCPNRCAQATSSWLARRIRETRYQPDSGRCADQRET